MKTVFVSWLLQCHAFHESYTKKRFWTDKCPREYLDALFNWDDLNHCLTTNRITNDRLRLSTAHGYEHFNKRVFRPTKDSFGRATDYLVLHELQAVISSGVTAVLESVNELALPVTEMTESLACELGVRSATNAYVSFGATSGFGVHNDDHDVLVLQLDGRKQWRFFSSDTAGEKATILDLAAPADSEGGDSVIIEAGDIMYIPKGTWHDVTAMNERSLHLTVSLVNPTLLDFVQWELKKQKQQLSHQDIRRSAPLNAHQNALCRNAFEPLFNPENLEAFLASYHASHAVSPIKATFPSLHSANVEDAFRRIAAEVVASPANGHGQGVSVFMLGRAHQLTTDEYKLLLALPSGSGKPGSDLLSDGRQWTDIAPLLTSLMDRGLVGKKPAAELAPR